MAHEEVNPKSDKDVTTQTAEAQAKRHKERQEEQAKKAEEMRKNAPVSNEGEEEAGE